MYYIIGSEDVFVRPSITPHKIHPLNAPRNGTIGLNQGRQAGQETLKMTTLAKQWRLKLEND